MKALIVCSVTMAVLVGCDLGTSVGDRKTDIGASSGGGSGSTGGGTAGGMRRVFVTSGAYTGDLKTSGGGTDGLDGADKICNAAAKGAGLPGTFKAWLSTETTNAIDRMADGAPWFTEDDKGVRTTAFINKTNMQTVPLTPLRLTELGKETRAIHIWTGTGDIGLKGDTCNGFTNASASTSPPAQGTVGVGWLNRWGASWSEDCYTLHPFFCFEQ